MDLGPSLALQVDRQEVGPAGEQHPEQLSTIASVAHLGGDHRKDAAGGTRIAAGFAVAQGCVGFIDDDDDGPHGPQNVQDLLEVALGLADVLGAKVSKLDAGYAD